MTMLARHLLWHLGVAAAAVVVLTAFGMAWASALVIGVMAGCVAMLFQGGHGSHDGAHTREQPAAQEVERR